MKKYIMAFVIAIIVLGIFVSINNHLVFDNLSGFLFSPKVMLINIGLVVILFILGLTGFPTYFFYLTLDLFTLGLLIPSFFISFSFKGLIYLLIYYLLFKSFSYFLLILNTFYAFKYAKNLYRFIFNRFGQSIHNIKLYFKKMVIISTILICYTAIYNMMGKYLMNFLAKFLLK